VGLSRECATQGHGYATLGHQGTIKETVLNRLRTRR
jgi:hypothetical protein